MSDTFSRTVAGGWGSADTGGAWTVVDTAVNWSVAPGTGSIVAEPGAQERAYLGAVSIRDVEITAKISLPRSAQGSQLAFVMGRYTPGANPTYYRVGVGQGGGPGSVFIRTQRADGTFISPDISTGIPAANGVTLSLRVQFSGASPTLIRARAWLDGIAEPGTWQLTATDSTASMQAPGAVGVRMRNEDNTAAHTFAYQRLDATDLPPDPTATPTLSPSVTPTPTPSPTPAPTTTLAVDSFERSETAAWGSAETGGYWTTVGTPPNWSTSPGTGAVVVSGNREERAYLSAVRTRDVEILTKVLLPRSPSNANTLAYVLGRYAPAYSPTYYRIGVGQGGVGRNVFLRTQRHDGSSVAADVDTGIPPSDGVAVWLRVQLQGANPTAIRARVWADGAPEPGIWMLNATDSTPAMQAAGSVGVRVRSEDGAATLTFLLARFEAAGAAVAGPPVVPNPTGSTTRRLFYVFPDRGMDIYDIDDNHALIKHVDLPTSGVAGVAMSPATGMLYLSECLAICESPATGGQMLKYDLRTDTVVWIAYYPFGVDSMAITPDGQTIYSPDGLNATTGLWRVLDGASGAPTGSIFAGVAGHNTVVSIDGAYAYLGGYKNGPNVRYLQVVDTATNQIIRQIGPLVDGVRPFTINGTQTLAFTTASNFLGFQVSDVITGQVLYTVPVNGFTYSTFVTDAPSHGISLSPDEREVYVIDGPNSYVHVFDVSGLPASPPVQVADIAVNPMVGLSSPCAARCQREGWLLHSGDGRFLYVGDAGNVIDTSTRQTLTTIASLANTRKFLEIDWQNGAPIFTTTRHGLGYDVTPAPPTPTPTASETPTVTVTPDGTSTVISTASATGTPTPTSTGSPTPPPSPTATPTPSPTSTATPVPGTLLARDTFQRPDQSLWGVASDGQSWRGDANALTGFSISGNAGRIAGVTGPVNAILGPVVPNCDVLFTGSLSTFSSTNLGAVVRWNNTNNWYKAYVTGTTLVLQKRVGAVYTILGTAPFTGVAGVSYSMRFQAVQTTLRVRVWPAAAAEPATWALTAVDSSHATGSCGLRIQMTTAAVARITSFTATSP